jgi:hypothetical protein
MLSCQRKQTAKSQLAGLNIDGSYFSKGMLILQPGLFLVKMNNLSRPF